MPIGFLLERFAEDPGRDSLVWRNRVFDYRWLLDRIAGWRSQLEAWDVPEHAVVVLEGDYSPNGVALLLALVGHRCVVVPLAGEQSHDRREEALGIVEGEYGFRIRDDDEVEFESFDRRAVHPLYAQLRSHGHPGLVLFSSGTTGSPKAAVHDFERLLRKYRTRRRDLRTLTFLGYDHIGGVDTLLYSLSNASCVVTIPDRLPETVCAAVERFSVEVLPVSPGFLNLLILSQAYERFDLSSLKVITYGSEVMPQSTLQRCHEIFPRVQLLQKFGTTEVGTLRSKSKAPDSTWVKIGGEGYETRVVDGILQIKAHSAILGYLNAPSPFTEDGWFVTGDLVEVDGEFIRILGRESDVINVGGEKVLPAVVEEVIQELPMVREVAVFGEPNAILGNLVCARASLVDPPDTVDERAAIREIKRYCRERLRSYEVPVKIAIVERDLHTERNKKMRSGGREDSA